MDLKKTTEVIAVGSVLAISVLAAVDANATLAVTSASTAQTVAVTAGAAGSYVVTAFNLNVSANTSVGFNGNPTQVAVQSANVKGMHHFGGSSQGGSVSACETTSVATPTASDPTATGTGCN